MVNINKLHSKITYLIKDLNDDNIKDCEKVMIALNELKNVEEKLAKLAQDNRESIKTIKKLNDKVSTKYEGF